MKIWSINIIGAILIMISGSLMAQNGDERKYIIQFDYGISRTFHYIQPIQLRMCIDGCYAEDQKARMASNFDLSIYQNFDRKNSVKIGIGLSEYRFWENEMIGPGNGSFAPRDIIRELKYFAFSTGYKHIFGTTQLINPFFELDLLFEIPRAESYLHNKSGVAIKPQIGAHVRISDKLNIVFSGFYKSGIVRYSEIIFDKVYLPFGYGIEVGVNMKI